MALRKSANNFPGNFRVEMMVFKSAANEEDDIVFENIHSFINSNFQ